MTCGALLAAAAAAAVLTVATDLALATNVNECSGESRGQLLFVDIAGCDEPPCVLKKNTNASVQIKFIPDYDVPIMCNKSDRDVDMLRNHVFARVWGIPLPFVGVDGESSCENIYLANGDKAGCPLHAYSEYLYKDSFEIRSVYPSISPMVHWGLLDYASGSNVVCFEVKSSIES